MADIGMFWRVVEEDGRSRAHFVMGNDEAAVITGA
jgi:hypothetical protein